MIQKILYVIIITVRKKITRSNITRNERIADGRPVKNKINNETVRHKTDTIILLYFNQINQTNDLMWRKSNWKRNSRYL